MSFPIKSSIKAGTITLIASMAIALSFVKSSENPTRPEIRREPADLSTHLSKSSDSPLTEFRFQPAQKRYVYRFERKITFQGLKAQDLDITYRGELYFDVLQSQSSGFEALVSHKIEGHPQARTIYLREKVNPLGSDLQIFADSAKNDEETQHQNILKDLLSNWLFPLNSDTVGPFEAKLENLSKNRAKKQKLRYLKQPEEKPEILTSVHFLEWDPSLRFPKEISGEEKTQLGKGQDRISSMSQYRIQFVKTEPLPQLNPSTLTQREDLSVTPTSEESPVDPALSWNEIANDLFRLSRMNAGAQLGIFAHLTKILKVRPETASQALSLLRSENVIRLGTRSPLFNSVVGALASVGTSAAQAAILEIYQDPACPIPGKGAILAALTTTQAMLESSTRDFLISAMKNEENTDLAHGAAFALGASLRETQDPKALALIQDRWTQSNSAADRLALLDAMGNSGSVDYLTSIRSVIDGNETIPLRAKAIFALRFIPGDEPRQILDQHLSDPDPQIRRASADAIAARDNALKYR